MYNRVVDVDNLDSGEILYLLEACDELNFNELIEDLQKNLLENNEWIHRNLSRFYKISSQHQSFDLLQGYCIKLIDDNPELLLNSDIILYVDKSVLTIVLKKDYLELDEIDIWNCVIQWGIGQ